MDLSLGTHEMHLMRRLLLAEPEPDALLPHAAVESLTDLIGCDGFGSLEADAGP
jgi:hypothetical protein